MRDWPSAVWAGVLGLFLCCVSLGQNSGAEVLYPSAAYAKLDTFEAANLEDADKLYIRKDFNGALAAYKAFSSSFPKSKATPYVLLRMGRCLHESKKRNAAIKAYQDVVDYFPDDVLYAAAALYYKGECCGQDGDEEQKMAVWARMVKDPGYVGQPNSGTALTYLGQAMEKLGRFDEAAEYHWRTALSFRQSNPAAAQAARMAVIRHYVVRTPNHEKLKEFYTVASGFNGRGESVDKPQDDPRYWSMVLDLALKADKDKEKICLYWGGAMGDRFADNDALRKLWCDVMLVHEKDPARWLTRLEKQFAQQPATLGRILQWCAFYGQDPKVRAEFFQKNSKSFLAGLKLDDKLGLMGQLKQMRMTDEAESVFRSLSLPGLTADEDIRKYAFAAANYQSEDDVLRILARIKDAGAATKARFDYFMERNQREKALAEIPALKKEPKYAGASLAWTEATLLRDLGRLEDAIKAYQAANRQPDSTWAVTECLVALKQYPQAIKNIQGIESVGGAVAAQACLKVADIYRLAGDKGKEVEQLRLVLRRYPKTGQSSDAHQRLERYGLKVTGGEAKADG